MVKRVAQFGGAAEFKSESQAADCIFSFLNVVIFSFLPPLAVHVTEFKLSDRIFLGSHSSKNQRIWYFLIFCTDDLAGRVSSASIVNMVGTSYFFYKFSKLKDKIHCLYFLIWRHNGQQCQCYPKLLQINQFYDLTTWWSGLGLGKKTPKKPTL